MAQTRSPRLKLDLTKPFNFWDRVKEIDLFFQRRDPVHVAMRRLVRRLEKVGISYAIMGGMAVNAHKHERTTKDVDVLLTKEGLEKFQKLFVPKHYAAIPKRDRRYVDKINKVKLDVLVTGRYPGNGEPGPIAFPDPEDVEEKLFQARFVNLPTLVQLKLAARRHQDFADVVNLIRYNDLDESFTSQLHPSVRQDYIECLEEKRRDDEYDSRI